MQKREDFRRPEREIVFRKLRIKRILSSINSDYANETGTLTLNPSHSTLRMRIPSASKDLFVPSEINMYLQDWRNRDGSVVFRLGRKIIVSNSPRIWQSSKAYPTPVKDIRIGMNASNLESRRTSKKINRSTRRILRAQGLRITTEAKIKHTLRFIRNTGLIIGST